MGYGVRVSYWWLMTGRDRSLTATSEHHGLQNAAFGERLLRKKLEGSNGSLCKGYIATLCCL